MKKYAVIECGKIKRIVVCGDPALILCGGGQYTKEIGNSKAKIGDHVEAQIQWKTKKDCAYLWAGIASAAIIGVALAYKYIVG